MRRWPPHLLPDSQKHAIVPPLLKKPSLNAADTVSNLTFVSKVTERAVAQSVERIPRNIANDLLPRYQPAYTGRGIQQKRSCYTCLVGHTDSRQVTLLGLLDLSAAFDCVDHDILLQRLQIGLGMSDILLEWIRSFLTNRTQQVAFNGQLSSKQPLLFGVPQGSVAY